MKDLKVQKDGMGKSKEGSGVDSAKKADKMKKRKKNAEDTSVQPSLSDLDNSKGMDSVKKREKQSKKKKTAEVAVVHPPMSDSDEDDEGFNMFSQAAAAAQRKAVEEGGQQRQGRRDHNHITNGSKQPRAPKSSGKESATEKDVNDKTGGLIGENEEVRSFELLGLEKWLVKSCDSMGMKRPTDVQWNCIGPALEGRNILASAQTGSGKTAAFALPILQLLSADPYGVFALVLVPTRELAYQIRDQFVALGSSMNLRESVVVGGMDMMKQAKELISRPHVVIATPGRLADHIKSSVGVADALSRVKMVVFDEADRLLEECFEPHLATILDAIPPKRATMLFSATITASIEELRGMLPDCFKFDANDPTTTVNTVTEQYCHMPVTVKDCYLMHVVRSSNAPAMIIFTGTKKTCQFVGLLLEVGRTARAGRTGLALSLVTQYDVALLQRVEECTGKKLTDAGVDEDQVHDLLTEVMKARRVVKVKMLEFNSEGQDQRRTGGAVRQKTR